MAEFRWFGHNCFRIRAREATILTDPLNRDTGYAMAKQTADIVTISHDHPGHSNLNAVKPEYHIVRGPGEYEMHGVFITGIRTYHDEQNGAERGYNTAYLIELEGMVICHLGDLGHPLSEEHAEAMSKIDILLIPAGGGVVLDPVRAAEIIGQLDPKIVIPMQYATSIGDTALGGLDVFTKQLGVTAPPPEEKLVIRHADLGETVRVLTLQPESESIKR
ncbi:MAG: MBL fold metallo-hydrolase [Chloroflexia bacterium]|jgi:L-ascorbate metabolism protein UlaG (beta-lactamase superfamily)|nr:MBL fold metallo-hydrolase [Chloroflexia bacterium]